MKRFWKIAVACVVCLILLTVSLSVSMHLQPANGLETYKQQLRDQGEKLDVSQFEPHVAPQDNSVDAVEAAFALMPSSDDKLAPAMVMAAPGKAIVCFQQPEVRGYQFTNSWSDLATQTEASLPALTTLHNILDRPKLDFQLDYTKGAGLLLPHLAPMKRSAQQLTSAAVLELHDGDNGAALTNILTLLALVHNDASEGLLISHLVRLAMTAIAITPTWEFLQATNLTDAQLAALQNAWQQLNILGDAENAYGTERAWMAREIEKSRASHEAFASTFGSGGSMSGSGSPTVGFLTWETITERPRLLIAEEMWRSSWSYTEELRMLHSDQIVLETVRSMETNRNANCKADLDAMNTHLASLGLTNAASAIFRALEIPDFHEDFGDWVANAVRRSVQGETSRRIAIAAIALKRYQLKYGHWPESITNLTPEFVAATPIDPYDGNPMKYHANPDGTFSLYSVAQDGVDDGGNPTVSIGSSANHSWQNPHARDWVWPQPATPTDVQYYYEHPQK